MTAAGPSPAEAFVERLLKAEDPAKRRRLVARHGLAPADLHAAVLLLIDKAYTLMGAVPTRMEQLCLAALSLAEDSGDEFLQAMARGRHGDALRALGRNTEACATWDVAAAIFTRLGRPVEAARTRIGWVVAAAYLGRLNEALAAARAARRVLVAHQETFRVAALDMNTGNVYFEHGHYAAALRWFTSALALFRSVGDAARLQAGRCHSNRGRALTRLGRYDEALTDLQLARAVYADLGEQAGAARVMRTIGEHHLDLGRYTAALRALDEARDMCRALDLSAEEIWVAQDTADCYLRLNRPAAALAALAGIEANLARTEDAQDALGVTARRVTAFLRLGQREAARQAMDEAERRHPAGAIQHRAWLAAQRAALLLQDGDAEAALSAARQAQSLAQAAGMRRLVADALVAQGAALLALGRPVDAARVAMRARRRAQAMDAAPLLQRVYELLGAIAEAQRRPAIARRRYTMAIGQLEREQREVIFEFREGFASSRAMAYQRLASLQLAAGRPAEALATAERAKSRALADAIAGVIQLRPRGSAAVRRLARALAAAREDYAATAAQAARDEAPAGIRGGDGAGQRLAELEQRIARLLQQIQLAAASDETADLYGATASTLPALDADAALIEFFFSGDDILRFCVDASGVRGTALAGAAAEIERLVRLFRLNLDATERAEPHELAGLAAQARTVLARVRTRLLGDLAGLDAYRSLVIVPHGLLHYLPFHALHDGERHLIEQCAISYAPSAALYGICHARAAARPRRARPRKALVLAHSAGGLLPFTGAEAAAVGAVLGAPVHAEQAATRARLQSVGRHTDLIHIAAHGRFRQDVPLFSAIELADGPLTTVDVFDLQLRTELVALSACETGRSVLGGGDELIGLTRAFLYAGAATLLVSQWRVDDQVTAALMARFYQELERGVGPAEALRLAQIASLAEAPDADRRAHPFYWAAFQIIGDGHGAQTRPPRAQEEQRA